VSDSASLPASVHEVARATDLAVVLDLDGTLIPFAATTSEARLDVAARELVLELARCPRTQLVIVSGRRKGELAALFPDPNGPWLVAEHGGWRRRGAGWSVLDLDAAPPDEVETRLREVAALHDGAIVERKTWSVCLHYRGVPEADREGTYVEGLLAIEGWLRHHPEYEVLEGHLVLEVRHRAVHKGTSITWLQRSLPRGTRLLAIGDDVSDEDTFAALDRADVAIAIGPDERPTRAEVRLADVDACRAFLRWLRAMRRSEPSEDPVLSSGLHQPTRRLSAGLLVVSNRLPAEPATELERDRAVGGVAPALASILASRHGVWLGWSGRTVVGRRTLAIDDRLARASFDLHPDEHALYYNGFANRGLWPVMHGFVGRARFHETEWRAFVDVTDTFADHAMELVRPDATVWAHDFHMLLLARALRARGHIGLRGLFLHVPFPPVDAFEALPHATHLLAAMLDYDLVGFHTQRHASNFVRAASTLLGATETSHGLAQHGRRTRIGVFPLGIDAAQFRVTGAETDPEILELRAALRDRKLVLGVDRLDYTKGIDERLGAFARLFEVAPEWRAKTTLLQVAVPSRADVPEYAAQRDLVEASVGRINGELGEAHWMPVRYVRRSYGRTTLAQLYRAADVALVTPLRDGMNLVAKEYVAAQDPTDPGVLVLSRFAGAADELHDALLTNPYDREGTARAIARALSMTREERIARHERLRAAVSQNAPDAWAGSFLSMLAASG
jgi:trehalose 6-phosphate synthase